MKLTAVLLLVACFQVSARGFGQGTVTISLRDVLVTEVFKEIEKQTSFRFLYRDELVKKAGVISIVMKDATVEAVLNRCFDRKPLEFKIFKETIVISEKSSNGGGGNGMIEESLPLINVTGKVLNEQGKPLEGVTVTIKNTDKSTITNANGEFFLSSVEQDAVLVFSAVNMEPFELKVSGKSELVVNLKAKTITLGEVEVIHTGFQDVPKERATGSFVVINNKQFERRVSSDILSRLEGIASGVLIDGNQANPLDNVSIRGRSTIIANARPLIILDNFPYTGDLNSINPNDIESITILKDAAAASIWGAYSGNGVIVITRKRGKYNQGLRVNINSNLTVKSKPDLFYDQGFLNATDFIDIEVGLFNSGFYDADLDNTFTLPAVSGAVEILAKRRAGLISAADSATQIGALRGLDIRKDYEKYLYRTAVDQQYAVNVSGGSDKASYYLSGGYIRDASNTIRVQNERVTFNSAMTFKPIRNLEITGGILYTQGMNENNGFGNVVSGGKGGPTPYTQLADQNGNYLPVIGSLRQSFIESPVVIGLLDWRYFPLEELRLNDNTARFNNNVLNFGVKYEFIKGLSAEAKFQYQKGYIQQRIFYSPESFTVRDMVNRFSVIDADQVVGRNVPMGGILSYNNISDYNKAGRLQLNFQREFKKDRLVMLAGIDVSENKTEGNSTIAYGYDDRNGTQAIVNYDTEYLLYPSSVSKIPSTQPHSPYRLNRRRSFFGNAAYTISDKYTISASTRLDQANIFGVKTNQKGRPFWSAGLAWDISRESFYKISWLPYLKFRTTYGYNGNYSSTSTAYTTGNMVSTGGLNPTPITFLNDPGNPQLRWEKIGIINFALDFQVGENIVSGTVEYFRKNGDDMIGSAFIPSSTGYTTAIGNYSDMKSSGIDVTLNKNLRIGEVNWNSSILLSYAKDKITKMAAITGFLLGKPVSAVYSYSYGGLDENGDPLGYLDGELSKDYATLIARGTFNHDTKIYNGPGTPVLYGGFNTELSWRGFAASVIIRYKMSYYVQKSTIQYGQLYNAWQGHRDFYGRWQKAGDETTTAIPALVDSYNPDIFLRDQFFAASEANIISGDHIRLQDFRVSYSFEHLKKLPVKLRNIQLYFYANNLGIIWKRNKFDLDPDVLAGYPAVKTYSFGLKAGL